MAMAPRWSLCVFAALVSLTSGYVDLRDITSTMTMASPTFTVPRPHQLPEDASIRYASQQSMITAIAPSMTMAVNGSIDTSWSIHYLQPDRRHNPKKRGVFSRQGVFSNASSLIETCTPCTSVTTGTSAGECHVLTYSGVFRAGYTPAPTGSLCYSSNYMGALLPLSTTSLPCCLSCTSPKMIALPITTGVLASSTTSTVVLTSVRTSSITTDVSVSTTATGVTTSKTSAGASTSITDGSGESISESTSISVETITITAVTSITITVPDSSSTETVIITYSTIISNSSRIVTSLETIAFPVSTTSSAESSSSSSPQITLSVTTVTPTTDPATETPIVLIQPAKISGCGTASGSGTVVGSGTVFIGPYGLIPVVSSGTVSGFASTIVGCGSMVATSGVFTGSASITGCGEGYGYATLTGSGTVYPAILGGLIPIVSSGTVTGSGRVVGCGFLTGTGTFTVKSLYTTTITPSARPTVNVYISYCPAEPAWRIGSNFSDIDAVQLSTDQTGQYLNSSYAPALPTTYHDIGNSSSLMLSNFTTNSTSNSTLANPFCQMCPNDAGICCPLNVACGADGHCPYTALQGCGYILFGNNIVDYRNSSPTMGMEKAPWRTAPGLPGEESGLEGVSRRSVVRQRKHKHQKKGRRGGV